MIKLGSKVKDEVTGFEGTAAARIEYLNGCIRYEVIPKVDKDGKYVDSIFFDVQRLVVLEGDKAPDETEQPKKKRSVGGPYKKPDEGVL